MECLQHILVNKSIATLLHGKFQFLSETLSFVVTCVLIKLSSKGSGTLSIPKCPQRGQSFDICGITAQIFTVLIWQCGVRMWAIIPHALDMLLLWALCYGKCPRSFKGLNRGQDISGEIKPQKTRSESWQIVRCVHLPLTQRYCQLTNLSFGTMIPSMCRMCKSEGIMNKGIGTFVWLNGASKQNSRKYVINGQETPL